MKVAIIIAPMDFRDETVSTAKNMLEKWGTEAVVTSYTSRECIGYHGALYKPQIHASHINSADFDAILLVDGSGVETYKLYDYRPLLDLVREFATNGKIVAGVNNSIKIIAKANVVSNVKIANPEDKETERMVRLFKGVITDRGTESSTNIMTSSTNESTVSLVDAILVKLGAK